jgi:hypothetical protein
MPDGSLLFTEQDAGDGRIVKIATDGTISTFVDNTNRTIWPGLRHERAGWISAQSHIGRIGAYSGEGDAVETVDGLPVVLAERSRRDSKGGIFFTDPWRTPFDRHRPSGRASRASSISGRDGKR